VNDDAQTILFLHTLTTVCVRALPDRHYWSQANKRGVVAELLDNVAKHRFVYKISVLRD